ncbi:MAG: SGNH/GDSL hydrolase family protein [Egibacteraceae bacterium]
MVAWLLLAVLAVLVVEGYLAVTAEYLPSDPGYTIDTTVGPTSGEPADLVILGDSTAAGVGSPSLEESLPVLVAERVASRLGRPVHVTGLSVPGARTATALENQVPMLAGLDPDVVLIVIGANDVTHVTPPWAMRRQTAALIDGARAASGAPVVIGGIPEFRTVPALLQPLRWVVGRYASALREVQRGAVRAAGVPYVDIAALASPRFIGKPESMSPDGYHPSPLGYSFWADALAPAVAETLTP